MPRKAGRPPTLSESEVLTLVILAQWPRFRSERDFWRFADSTISGRIPRGARTTRGVSDRAAVYRAPQPTHGCGGMESSGFQGP